MNQKNVGHTIISYILNLAGISIMLYIGVRYINSSDELARNFAVYAFLMSFLAFLGFIAIDYFDNREINLIPKKFNEFKVTSYVLITFITWIIGMIIDFVLKVSIRYAMEGYDQALYYVFAGVCEEAFFRAFLINVIMGLLTKKGEKPHVITIIFALIASSIAFMLVHLQVYGNNLPMLLSTLLGGLLLGSVYIMFRDISANMSAHFLKNVGGYLNLVGFSF